MLLPLADYLFDESEDIQPFCCANLALPVACGPGVGGRVIPRSFQTRARVSRFVAACLCRTGRTYVCTWDQKLSPCAFSCEADLTTLTTLLP